MSICNWFYLRRSRIHQYNDKSRTCLLISSFSPFRKFLIFQTLTGGLTNLFGSKPKTTEVQPQVPVATQPQPTQSFLGGLTSGLTGGQQPAAVPRTTAPAPAPYQPPPVAAAPAAPAAPVAFDLDKIPGLDDDFEPVPTAPPAGARPRPGAAGLKPGQKPAEEGGLLGGLTSGLGGLASGGVGGLTGGLTNLTGGAAGAAGGAAKAAGGLFKKFGF